MEALLNKLKQNWKIVSTLILILSVLVLVGIRGEKSEVVLLKCPDQYESSEEKIADFDKWTKDFYDKNPDASYADLSDARKQFYIDNNCTEALQRLADWESDDVDPEKKAMIYDVIDETFKDQRRFTSEEFGFSFGYPNSLIAEIYPEQPSWIVVYPRSKQLNEDEPMTAIIISTSRDDLVSMTAEEWLLSPNAGYKKSEEGDYEHIKVGGQDAVMTDNDWVIVKTPDGKTRISIAYLVEEEKGAKPLRQELRALLNSFSFK